MRGNDVVLLMGFLNLLKTITGLGDRIRCHAPNPHSPPRGWAHPVLSVWVAARDWAWTFRNEFLDFWELTLTGSQCWKPKVRLHPDRGHACSEGWRTRRGGFPSPRKTLSGLFRAETEGVGGAEAEQVGREQFMKGFISPAKEFEDSEVPEFVRQV